MPCVLRARGTNFAVDEFLAASKLRAIAVFRRGYPQSPVSPPGSHILTESGFHADVSEADFSDLQTQITDAAQFLERNREELARLVNFPAVERVSLDFGIGKRDVWAQSERFPPNLLRDLGNLGIWLELKLYPTHDTNISSPATK